MFNLSEEHARICVNLGENMLGLNPLRKHARVFVNLCENTLGLQNLLKEPVCVTTFGRT